MTYHKIPVYQALADRIPFVETLISHRLARVFQIILVNRQAADRNVLLTLNVHRTWRALMRNVAILVPAHVGSMPVVM